FQAEDGIRDRNVTGVQTCALPISLWGAVDDLIRPGAVRQGDVVDFLEEGQVAAVGHLRVALLVPGGLAGRDLPVGGLDLGWCGDEGVGVAQVFFPKFCWCRAVAMKKPTGMQKPRDGEPVGCWCVYLLGPAAANKENGAAAARVRGNHVAQFSVKQATCQFHCPGGGVHLVGSGLWW